jgi:hypothetical protein
MYVCMHVCMYVQGIYVCMYVYHDSIFIYTCVSFQPTDWCPRPLLPSLARMAASRWRDSGSMHIYIHMQIRDREERSDNGFDASNKLHEAGTWRRYAPYIFFLSYVCMVCANIVVTDARVTTLPIVLSRM